MKQRCYNPNDKSYSHYGGRGITVCKEWLDSYSTFMEWACANGYKTEDSFHYYTVDRIDVNGDYCPSNCRIIDKKKQNDNTTRTIYITYNGETHTLKEWSEITGILYHTLWCRINQSGWDKIDAITTPVNTNMRNKRAKVSDFCWHRREKQVGLIRKLICSFMGNHLPGRLHSVCNSQN